MAPPRQFMLPLFLGACVAAASLPAQQPQNISSTAALQIALDRNGFGVGPIDGREGVRTRGALLDFCRSRHLNEKAARVALTNSPGAAFVAYEVTDDDVGELGTAPVDWAEAADVPSMAHSSMDHWLAERFHASPRYIQRLNPAVSNWDASLSGVSVTVPNARPASWHPAAARLEVDCRALRLRAFDTNDILIASFPCSIAVDSGRVPKGDLRVAAFAPDPNYTFDPVNFPESARAQEIGRKLIIPPGPKNPVGVYWLSLSAPGFGIHGTPHPETIGRRESHGCFRLTNWDILTLAQMVSAGTPVRVVNVPPPATPAPDEGNGRTTGTPAGERP